MLNSLLRTSIKYKKIYIIEYKINKIMKKKRAKKKTVYRKKRAKKEIKETKPIFSLKPKRQDKTMLRLLVILLAVFLIYIIILMAQMLPSEQKTTGSNEQIKESSGQDTADSTEGSSEVVIEIT